MKRMLVFTFCLCSFSQPSPVEPVLTVCEAIQKAVSLRDKVVRIRGTYNPTDHGLLLRGDCEGVAAGEGYIWAPVLSIAGRQSQYDQKGLDFNNRLRADERLTKELQRLMTNRAIETRAETRITVTYVGILSTHSDLDKRPGDGFGPLNVAAAELYVLDVDTTTVVVDSK